MIDPTIRHMVFVQRFAGGRAREAARVLRDMETELQRLMFRARTDFQTDRLSALLLEVRAILDTGFKKHSEVVLGGLSDFSQYELDFNHRLLGKYVQPGVPLILPQVASAIVDNAPMALVTGSSVQTLTVPGAVAQFTNKKPGEVLRVIQTGAATGRTIDETARDVSRVVNNRTRSQSEALVRTSVNHISNQARAETYNANADVIDHERFIATLDGRTTLTCAGFDGKQFALGEGPTPALHWNCRSTRVPVVKDQYALTTGAQRASLDGPVDSRVTYGGFLRRQSAEFQNEVLGPERAKLFRSGRVSIDKFTDPRGVVLSLDELRAREGITI